MQRVIWIKFSRPELQSLRTQIQSPKTMIHVDYDQVPLSWASTLIWSIIHSIQLISLLKHSSSQLLVPLMHRAPRLTLRASFSLCQSTVLPSFSSLKCNEPIGSLPMPFFSRVCFFCSKSCCLWCSSSFLIPWISHTTLHHTPSDSKPSDTCMFS